MTKQNLYILLWPVYDKVDMHWICYKRNILICQVWYTVNLLWKKYIDDISSRSHDVATT